MPDAVLRPKVSPRPYAGSFPRFGPALLLGLILSAALALRLIRLDAPAAPVCDEGAFYLDAARSYLAGLPDPNFEHPPLGKLGIAAGMAVLGDTPWGWRIGAAVAGTAGVAFTYRLALLLWADRRAALLAAALLSLDFLWLVFSRLAQIDIFLATFVLAALGFAWSARLSGRDRDVLAAGFAVGLAAAVKWSGVWTLLPITLALWPDQLSALDLRRAVRHAVLVGGATLSAYLLPWLAQGAALEGGPARLATRHLDMWRYQMAAGADVAGGWDRLLTPLIWLLNPPEVLTSAADPAVWLLAMANPLVFWPGLAAVGWLVLRAVRAGRGPEAFLLLAILTFYLPWFAVARLKYFYYLLPVLPLLAVALAGLLHRWWLAGLPASAPAGRNRRVLLAAYLAVTAAALVGMYPALTGVWTR